MKTKKIKYAKEGQFYILEDGFFYHSCCGCGLLHKIEWQIVRGKLALAWYRVKKSK